MLRPFILITIFLVISQITLSCWAKPALDKDRQQFAMNTDKCRQKCLYKFPGLPSENPVRENCDENQDCLMCWDYCKLIPSVGAKSPSEVDRASEMCSDSVCFEGCQYVCGYYRIKIVKPVDTNQLS